MISIWVLLNLSFLSVPHPFCIILIYSLEVVFQEFRNNLIFWDIFQSENLFKKNISNTHSDVLDTDFDIWTDIYNNTKNFLHHYHHHGMLTVWNPLIFSCHLPLSVITLGKSS